MRIAEADQLHISLRQVAFESEDDEWQATVPSLRSSSEKDSLDTLPDSRSHSVLPNFWKGGGANFCKSTSIRRPCVRSTWDNPLPSKADSFSKLDDVQTFTRLILWPLFVQSTADSDYEHGCTAGEDQPKTASRLSAELPVLRDVCVLWKYGNRRKQALVPTAGWSNLQWRFCRFSSVSLFLF